MVHHYRAQFFFPFAWKQGTFQRIESGVTLVPGKAKDKPGNNHTWFMRTPGLTPHSPSTFGEYQYFHPHTRALLFGDGEKADRTLIVYEVCPDKIKDARVSVTFTRDGAKRTVTLDLDWVLINLYDMDVGCVSFGVKYTRPDKDNPDDQPDITFADVLDVNNVLRRSAPSFLDFSIVEQGPLACFQGCALDKCRQKENTPAKAWDGVKWADCQKGARELADTIKISAGNQQILSEDFGVDFDNFVTGRGKPNDAYYIGAQFGHWIDTWLNELNQANEEAASDWKHITSADIRPILDERNFVCSYLVCDKDDTGLVGVPHSPGSEIPSDNKFGILTDEPDKFRDNLYRYIFVDPKGASYMDHGRFRDTCLQNVLYNRFADQGSYYAYSRYSGTYLLHGEFDFFPNLISRHFNSMYFQMATLAITYRAILLELSRRSAELAGKVKQVDDLEKEELHGELEDLRADFLKFNNKYWFSEITGQEMGIEIFELWSRNMGNDKLFQEVEKEIAALHDFSSATIGHRIGTLTYISWGMVPLSILALLSGWLGLSIFSDKELFWRCYIWWSLGLSVLGLGLFLVFWLHGKSMIRRIADRCDKKKRRLRRRKQ